MISLVSIIYDCDPGIDDAVAILLAIKSKICKLKAITSVAGNVTSEVGIRNIVKLLYLTGKHWLKERDPPIAEGSPKPLFRQFNPEIGKHMHGMDGLGNTEKLFGKYKIPDKIPLEYEAIDLIISTILESKEPITLVATGPLTNIAKAINRNPRIKDNLTNLVIMGGAINTSSNINPVAEFNVHTDPDAAKIVLQSGTSILLVPLDATKKNSFNKVDIQDLEDADKAIVEFVRRALSHYMKTTRLRNGLDEDACYMHDALAMAIALNRYLMDTIKSEKFFIDVETQEGPTLGQIVADRVPVSEPKGCKPIEVCLDLDYQEFKKFFLETILE
jgi:inosine-uridine nucleoside N-ribohydrolase